MLGAQRHVPRVFQPKLGGNLARGLSGSPHGGQARVADVVPPAHVRAPEGRASPPPSRPSPLFAFKPGSGRVEPNGVGVYRRPSIFPARLMSLCPRATSFSPIVSNNRPNRRLTPNLLSFFQRLPRRVFGPRNPLVESRRVDVAAQRLQHEGREPPAPPREHAVENRAGYAPREDSFRRGFAHVEVALQRLLGMMRVLSPREESGALSNLRN